MNMQTQTRGEQGDEDQWLEIQHLRALLREVSLLCCSECGTYFKREHRCDAAKDAPRAIKVNADHVIATQSLLRKSLVDAENQLETNRREISSLRQVHLSGGTR